MDQAAEVFREVARSLAPKPKLTVTQWAEANRKLSSKSSARAGDWHTRPYQREPMDVFTDPSVHTIVLMVARQTLKTEIINNDLGYVIDQDPGPTLVVQFRDTDCKKWSKIRLSPMLRETPCLRDKVKTEKSRADGNTFEYKDFPGGHLSVVASGSPGNLAALPIRYLFCDEIDKYPASAGPAGDPISLAQGRQEEFWNRKTVLACTPTRKGASRIERAYEESDQREYEIKCPHCGTFQYPKWAQVKWDSSLSSRRKQCASAVFVCANPDCSTEWSDVDRWNASKAGRFRASAEFNGVAGFRVNGLARLGTKLSALVDEFLRSKGSQEALKTFINEQLAELWEEPGEQLEYRTLVDRREDYAVGMVPAGGLILSSSVDVQRADGGRLEVRVNARGENRERWMVDYRVFRGDPTDLDSPASPWRGVEAMLTETWATTAGAELPIERMFVDSGDGATTPFVYEWVSRQPRPRVWAIKGFTIGEPVGAPKTVETTTRGKRLKYGLLFKPLNVNFFKAQLQSDLRRRPPTEEEIGRGLSHPQGFIHIPRIDGDVADGREHPTFGDHHCGQLCNERYRLVRHKNGKSRDEWEKTGANEAWDTQVYCDAVEWDLGVNRWQPKHWEALRARVKALEPQADSPRDVIPLQSTAVVNQGRHSESDWLGDRGGDWF